MRCASFLVVRVRATFFLGLVAQRHDRVDGAQQNQCERKRAVQQQPAVQPAVQALLARKLPSFVANVFEISERDVRRGGQQRAQSGKHGARGISVCEALAVLFWPLQKRAHLVQVKTAKRRVCFVAQQNNFGSRSHGGARARADGGRGAQRNGRGGNRPQLGEAAGALNFSIRAVAEAQGTAERFVRAIGFLAQERTHVAHLVVNGFAL